MAKKEIRIFLDSNVILSGIISDKGSPRIILDLLSLGLPIFSGMTGRYNIIEIERNLNKRMPDILPVYNKYLSVLNLEIIPLPPDKKIKSLKDHIAEKDTPVLASAIMGKADYLVTGDKKDFAKLKRKGQYPFKITSPSEFLETILPEVFKSIEPDK